MKGMIQTKPNPWVWTKIKAIKVLMEIFAALNERRRRGRDMKVHVCVDKWQCFGQNVKIFDTGMKPNRTSDRVKCEWVWDYFRISWLFSKVRGCYSGNPTRNTVFYLLIFEINSLPHKKVFLFQGD